MHFVKANGSTSPNVFKGAEINVEPGSEAVVAKTVSLRQHSTRTHYAGRHELDVLVNGDVRPGASFNLVS